MTGSRLVWGDGYACFRGGPVADTGTHAHAAFQVVLGDVAVADERGTVHRGPALVVPPGVRHRMLAADDVSTVFVDPHSALADRLRRYGTGRITPVADLDVDTLRAAGPSRPAGLDARLLDAMRMLARPDPPPMPQLAAAVGLSPQRLRTLARQQLGVPLARWRLWRRLARAVRELETGNGLAEAATAAGFADQAHLTRQMRALLGVTPQSVREALSLPPRGVDRD